MTPAAGPESSTFTARLAASLDAVLTREPGGTGVGKALLRRLAGLCVERGCGRFEWRVLDWNAPSIRFYESLGATLMPEWQLVRMVEPEFRALAESGR